MVVGVVIGAVGLAKGLSGSRKQRRAYKKAQRAQERALFNKRTMEMLQLQKMAKRQQGALRTAVAKSGVTMSGSAAFALRESAELAAIDQLSLMSGYQSQIDVNRMRTRSYIRASRTQDAASILTGVGRALTGLENAGFEFFGGNNA